MSQLHQVTLSLTAAQLVAVATLLATGSTGNAAASAQGSASSSRIAEAGKADAPAKTPESTLPVIKDFKAELVPMLQAFAKKDKAGFEALMKKHGFAKVTDIEAKPETWGALAQACK